MSNEELEKLAHPEFWDERYSTAEADTPTHEWFRTFDELLPFLEPNLFGSRGPLTNPKILHLGSGDSTIPRDLAERGYNDQLCVDFSNVVVDLMSKRHSDIKGIEWRLLDVCNMDSVPSGSIDVAFDKGTLDAMIHGSPWSPPQDVVEKTAAYIQEVSRVLKNDGVFLYVTYRPQHFIMPRLNCPGVDWDIEVVVLGGDASLPYHGFVVKKLTNLAAFANTSKTEDGVTELNHFPTTDDARPATENGGYRLTAAYKEALYSFNKQAVEAIQQADGVGDLIKSLDQKRDELRKDSWFRRGLDLLHEPLRRLNLLLPLGKAFASLDPTAATAFGIVATVIGIAVGACGAVETIKDNIQQMLDYVPMIQQCDDLCEAGGSEAIYQALVKVYKELIEFYLVTSKSLRSSARATVEQLGGELARATGRFNAAAERLSRTISIATHQRLQQTNDLLKDHHVGNLLGHTKFKAIEMFHFEMKELRADQACEWILKDRKFRAWLASDSSQFLTFYGDMGCGKTVAASYVIDYLQGVFPRTLVLYTYSRTQASTNTLESIYMSLLIQLVERERRLKLAFKRLYDEEKRLSLFVDPMCSTPALESLLREGLKFFLRPLYIVLDGLDECDGSTCKRIIDFFNQLCAEHQASPSPLHVKVLVSSRVQEPIYQLLRDCATVSSFPSRSGSDDQLRKRDSIIVRRHIELKLDGMLTEEVKDWLLEKLPALSDGNAIWIDMVIRNIQKSRMRNKAALGLLMNAPRNLAHMYTGLFEHVVDGLDENRRFLSAALEILVTVRRPVDMEELTYATAVALATGDASARRPALSKLSSVASLPDIDVLRLKDLIGPFVASLRDNPPSNEAGRPIARERFAPLHASLTDWILLVQPSDWKDNLKLADSKSSVREDLQGHRKRAMEGKMLRICATYLLLDEFGDLELFNDSQKQAAAIPDGSLLNSPCPDDEDKNHEPAMSVNEDRFFDPVEQGFGPLFAYTASFWTSHLQSAPAESLPSIDQLRKLSAFRSRRFSNWRDQYRRPDCTKREQHEMLCQDPLGIVALFGPLSLLMTMVEESDFDDHYTFHQHSLVEALKLSLDYEDFAKCHVLFQHPSVQYDKFFQEALACYHRKREGIEQRPLAPEWDTLFGIVHDITASLTRNKLGNALMCNAARYGCLPLLKHLLDAAEKNIMLMEVVLTPWREHPGADQGTAWAYHQSIARAARFSHVETIKFLLSWPGIEAHFLHRDSFGFNVFHVAAQSQSSAETVALLLSYSNVGVDAETVQGDTPLNLYAFDHNCNLECVRLLLEVGGADVRGGPGPPSPLLRAAMNGNEALCHMLVTVGRADPQSVLSLNAGEVPGLLASINFGSIDAEQQRSMERSLLKLLCGLAHIDVGSQLPADYAQQ
ncbi:hypothetical protein ACHAP9_006197 [Verticillium nonalfalfae]